MLDLSKPLQTRTGRPVTILHKFYNGVQDMMVVSIDQGPTCSVPGAKPVEMIRIYDQRWGKLNGAPASNPTHDLDLMEAPPPDHIRYLVMAHVDHTPHVYDTKQDLPSGGILGQIKIVIDGRSNKIKECSVIP